MASQLILKAIRIIRTRPGQVYGVVRGMILFYCAKILRMFIPSPGVFLGKNVRLQKNRSVMAEAPSANIEIGDHCVVYENAKIEAYGSGAISIGENSVLGDIKIVSRFKIKIGKRFLSSWNVFIEDFDPHPVSPELRALQVAHIAQSFKPCFDGHRPSDVTKQWAEENWKFPGEEIIIGDDVWIGANVSVLKGAKIGNGCIVATGSTVLRGEYPDRSVIAGNPAKVVKILNK